MLLINLITNLISSLSEGGTLGVIFLAVSLISAPNQESWRQLPIMGFASNLPILGSFLQANIGSTSGKTTLFIILIGFALALQILVAITTYANAVSAGVIANRLSAKITSLLHRRTLSFSFSCACQFRVGDLLNYIQTGGNAVGTQIKLTNELFINSIQFFVYLSILIGVSPWLLLVAIAMASLMSLVQKLINPRIRHTSLMMSNTGVEMSSRVTENIQGLRLIHSTGELSKAAQSIDALLMTWLKHAHRLTLTVNLTTPISQVLPVLAISTISILSLLLLSDRQSGILPSLVTFVLALQRLNTRLNSISTIASGYANNSALISRLNTILGDEDKQFVRTGGIAFNRLENEIKLANVSLRYQTDLPPSLNEINLEIGRGQTIALVGPSGAGKSSLVDLLVGLYEPTEGSILIDGVDLNKINLSLWQQRLGVVSQDTFLLNTTIAGNIAYGCPTATRSEVVEAADNAQALDFIRALPEGLDTMIGERGYRLSGGQRQRISLARAILRNPDLLILDEATSALDTQSERLVQQAIERFENQHTVLVIAHRLSTIVKSDLICVMDQGSIVERGNHRDLLAMNGLYTRLWEMQAADK